MKSYSKLTDYYSDFIKAIPYALPFLERYKVQEYLESLPETLEPWELYKETNKALVDTQSIKDRSDKILFQNMVNIVGSLLLSLYVLPRQEYLKASDTPDVIPLVDLYKFLISNYENNANRLGKPIENISKPVYAEFLKYGLTITYEDNKKEYEKLVNELLRMLDLPNLYTEGK